MKVLIVVKGNYPKPEASSKRLTNYIKALQIEENCVEVLPVFLKYKYNYQDFLNSFLIPFLAFIKVLRKARDASAVFIYGFGWVGKLFIIIASKLRKMPVSSEINEKPYSIHGGSRRDIILNRFECFHKFCLTNIVYPRLNGFLVISDPLLKYINKFKHKDAIICKVPILVDFEFYQRKVEKPECIFPYILNSARLNDHKDGISKVFMAFATLINGKGQDLHFYLTSKMATVDLNSKINSIITVNKLDNRVTFLGDLDEDTLVTYQAHCCMVVLNKVDSEQNRYNFATKLGEYMSLGKPVITTKIGEVSNYLDDNVSCLYVDPDSPDEIAAAMFRLINDPILSKRIGEKGRLIAKNEFDFRMQSKKISQFFADQIKANPL